MIASKQSARHRGATLLALLALASGSFAEGRASAQISGVSTPRPNLKDNIERPLRYRAEGGDFVIENGAELFNRSLYGGNTAFRVEGGDRPEFVLYLPGRGGNLRLGIQRGRESRWLHDARHIFTRYRPGELIYEIRDPLLGPGNRLELQVLALHETDGLVLRWDFAAADGSRDRPELVVAFGGVNGERGVRDGDIGTEKVPISEWFQLRPEFCRDNRISVGKSSFELQSAVANIAGVLPEGTSVTLGEARNWNHLDALLAHPASAPTEPIAVARVQLEAGSPGYLALQRVTGSAAAAPDLKTYGEVGGTPPRPAPSQWPARYEREALPRVHANGEAHFRALREQVLVRTPDPYVDAAVGALNVAADAIWDEPQGAVMHGAIAWRTGLLGWRGGYAMDALGWHERARAHFRYWASRQNTAAIPPSIAPPEEATHLARNPVGLHTNGDMSNNHYDMNLVYIDALLRHLAWTGDVAFAREMWPVIERHLAWERRLFRREYGPQKLPLYEAYAAIWASDDLQYSGGGVTHASAYNFWHNSMAARVAKLLGKDPAPYEREAASIQRAMAEYLWLPAQGMFAEYRDWLGLQRAHPSAALWSFYHVLDAPGLVGARQAWQMTRYVDRALPHLPVGGRFLAERGIDLPGAHVLATSNWLPYTWSINNVVMGENMHAALGYWQAGRGSEAFILFKSALLASMYMGISPGNVGTMNYLDVYRREAQRDFADGVGTTSRALVEGLFGLCPDALSGTIAIQPGWPMDWPYASLRTPTLSLQFETHGDRDVFDVSARLPAVRRATLKLALRRARVVSVTLDGKALEHATSKDEIGREWLEFGWPLGAHQQLVVEWSGDRVLPSQARQDAAAGVADIEARARAEASRELPSASPHRVRREANVPIDLSPYFNDQVTQIFSAGKYRSPRSPFVSLAIPAQGIGAWAGHVNATAEIDDAGLRQVAAANDGKLQLPNGVVFATPPDASAKNVIFTSQWDNYPRDVMIPLGGRARRVWLLMAGSTHHMQSQFDNGEVVVQYQDESQQRLELRNPSNWWPIDQDYFIDDFQFRRPGPIPPRVDLATGRIRLLDPEAFKGKGGKVPGGAATVLELPLAPNQELRSLTVRALANDVVIGLMAATLER
jgi:Domain of unknown function (DUF4450)